MHLAVVVCGDRVDEAFTMLKSALLFSLKRIKFHIFTEHTLLKGWPRFVSTRFQYSIYPLTFSAENAEEWKNLFKPCAAQRLFLPVRPRHPVLHLCFNLITFPMSFICI
ncbi:hypothetical protein SKAU_G00096080 [Synaphobranchus kaupii]|uniref:Glucoside xylosyltransferase 1 n=1 Tax=Synaphobranchus kaupii TaxID=118154 RepID=A0A9Q1FYJ2_SYNKA|nr:hypothetical protein SKAU_G00096080 [Synaphobranchus kaupii]